MMHADTPAFVPSSKRVLQQETTTAGPSGNHPANNGQQDAHASSHSEATGNVPHERSVSENATSGLPVPNHPKFDNAIHHGQHARSQSVPHPAYNAGRGARGGPVPRGRGASRGARGGSRGGHAGNTGSNIPVKRPVLPPPQPSVHLDSVDEFPALGGGHLNASSTATTPTSATSTSSSASSSADGAESTNGQTSPSLSLADSQDSFPQHPVNNDVGGSMKKSQSISFARVVAPAPPADPAPAPSSSSMSTGSGSQQQAGLTTSASLARSTSNSSNRSSKSASHRRQQSQQQQHMTAPQHQHHQRRGSGQSTDSLNVIQPEHIERPHFEPQSHLPPPPPPQPHGPTLTPLQIAFIEANGLSVEGLPNLASSGFTAQSLPAYYRQDEQGSSEQGGQGSGIPRSTSTTKQLTKAEKARIKKQQQKEQQQWQQAEAQAQFQQQQYYGYGYPPQASQPQSQDPKDSTSNGREPASSSMGMQRSQSHGAGSFHFSAAAPTFTPHHPTHLSPSAPSFEPHHSDAPSASSSSSSSRPELPALNGEAHEFKPHEEPVVEEQEETQPNEEMKDAIKEADAIVPDREDRQDLPNGTSQEAYEENEVPKEGLDEKSIPTPEEDGAEVLDAKVAEEAIPEQETREEETVAQLRDSTTATIHAEAVIANSATTTNGVQSLSEKDMPSQEVIAEADAAIPDRNIRIDLPNGTSQEAYEEDETPKPMHGEEDLLAPEDGGVESGEAPHTSAADLGKQQIAEGADVLDAEVEEEAIPEQERQNHEDEEIAEQMTDPATATNDADLDSEGKDGAAQEQAEASPSSPPHSTFSLLPPVSVEDVLEKAMDFVGLGSSRAEEAKEGVEDPGSSSEAPAGGNAKANIDDLDVETEGEQEGEAGQKNETEAPISHDVKANLDELDLSTDSTVQRAAEAQTSDEAAANLDELDMSTITASDLPGASPHTRESSNESATVGMDVSKASMSPSEVEETLMSSTEGGQALDKELASASRQSDDRPEVISTSGERCTPWDDEIAAGSSRSVLDQDDEEEADRSIRSAAPSPQLPTIALGESSSPRNLSINVPPIVFSPSSPLSPVLKSVGRPMPATPTTPAPLEDDSSKRLQEKPDLSRRPSEAEKLEAIRLINELRSGRSTPAAEAEEAEEGDKENIPPANADTSFKFERTGKLAELSSSKRKRTITEEKDNDEQDDSDKLEEKKLKQEEAPSLTLSIFSGSILPRKQLILSILASAGINIFLPFVNGVMLGFGEILARDWIGPFFGFGRRNNNNSESSRFNTSGLGLRNAGSNKRGGAQDVPGHAATKTVIETVADKAL